ncbi:unnamed protein product [Trichogramma brassicae]|uniref:UDP-glycosyltransferase n=1 Tax=Trichogramma brassicae TaxID=86971 RepID=A0A6H5I5N7_9HYME|nr:unnamed protein product [Trichogramma brassicae]
MASLLLFASIILQSASGLRILGLFPYQGKSHFTMCEALMRGLSGKGHQVDVYSHFPLKNPIPNYKDFSLAGSLPAVANNMTYEDVSKATGTDMIGFWIGKIGTSVCRLMDHPLFQELFHHPPRDPPYDIIVHEVSVTHCFIPWGRHLGIPIVAVITLPLLDWLFEPLGNPINLAAEPSIFSPYAAPMSFLQRLDNFIRFKSINRDFDRFSEEHARYVEKYFGISDRKPIELIKDVSLVLVNYDYSVSGVRPFAPIVVPVGGLHILDHNDSVPEALQTWLDQSDRGFVYVSFGSMTRLETFPRHVIDTFYKSFQNIAPVRVLLKIAKPEEMPAGMPDNVLVQTWLPQIQILSLFPRNERNHFAVCGELMRGLAERGHYVDVYSHFPLEEYVVNYTDISLRGTLPEEKTVFLPDDLYERVSKEEQLERWLRTYGKSICELMSSTLFQALFDNAVHDPQYDLIITEAR